MAANVANNLTALGAEVHTILPAEPWSAKERYIDERSWDTIAAGGLRQAE
jgi:hypothetical protein